MKQPPRGEGWKHTYVLYCNICVAKAGYIFLDSYIVREVIKLLSIQVLHQGVTPVQKMLFFTS